MTARGRSIPAWRCARGHLSLYHNESCASCGQPARALRIPAFARLVTCTTVRVNPGGEPFRLGVARTRNGAATLCIVEGAVRNNGMELVRLEKRGDHFVALGAGSRVTGRSRHRSATRGGSQKS